MTQKVLPSKKIIIYIDTGEMRSKIADILKKRSTIRKKKMKVADYILSKNVACERKTTDDFLQSMVDGRLFRQLDELKNNYSNPLFIIEGHNLIDNERNIHPNAIRGALASIALEFSIPIIWTRNQHETAEMLYAIAKREQIQEKRSISIRCKKKFKSMNEVQEFLISGLPNISNATARKMLKYFSTPEEIFTAECNELMKVPGIGEKMAKKIREIMTSKYEKSILED